MQTGFSGGRAAGHRPALRTHGAQEGEGLQGFAEAHFIGEDAAEFVFTQEMEPGDAVFLLGAQDGFQIAERWTC